MLTQVLKKDKIIGDRNKVWPSGTCLRIFRRYQTIDIYTTEELTLEQLAGIARLHSGTDAIIIE